MLHPYIVTPFKNKNKNKWITLIHMNICNSMGESPKHYVKWKKPEINVYILYNSICMIILKGKSMKTQYESAVIMSCEWEESTDFKRVEGNFWE